jgi:hypothetical protein
LVWKNSDGVTTVVEGGTCNKEERSIGGRDGSDDMDTSAVGIREGDEEEVIINGDSLKGLLSIVLSWLGS